MLDKQGRYRIIAPRGSYGPRQMIAHRRDSGSPIQMISQRNSRSKTTDLVSQVVAHVDKEIAAGRLVPGRRLTEAQIARQLGIGRVPIREALRILAGDGVVDLIPQRGAQIRKLEQREVFGMVTVLISQLQLAFKEFSGKAAHAKYGTRLREIARRIKKRIADRNGAGLLKEMSQYQLTVILGSENRYLREVFGRLHLSHYSRQVLEVLPLDELLASARAYQTATTHLLRRDGNSAAAAFDPIIEEFLKREI